MRKHVLHEERNTLADCPLGTTVRIRSVDWDALASEEARRLHALGIEPGASLKLAYRGIFAGRDPLAVEIGRMTIALRRVHALAILVEDVDAEARP
ncbi:FeoA family protein [Croceicoccus sp. F390]|uniref:FeoA family protein n=1 Tax=Croceicoccus esteveae TaxID=3075597 RepID=A0ABU2ZFY9_9SPHN|nr:FeoA family protein [Croceicoccus sp. F390]MDT0575136.1 FeoA family protein [Croceicoccus sp. F390]